MPSTPPPAGGPIIIDSFSARLSIRPWGNCKTYSTSYSWWILRVSKVWSSPEDHVNAISKHVNGTPIFIRNIWSTMLNFIYQLSKHRYMGIVIKFLPPYLNGFYFLSCHGYHALLVLGKDISLKYVFKHIFLSIVLFNLMIIFSFHCWFNLSCELYDLSSNILLLM